MPRPQTPAALAERILNGNTAAIARGISWAESGGPEFQELLSLLYGKTGRARITGFTGSPGAGKSTLTAAVARLARLDEKRVGIIAVDPTSPFSGGAILGDRIRMQDLYTDPGVLIRSMATRGQFGGLARATADAVDILDASGFDEILVETVGVGQDEVEVFQLAETCVVVLTPGMGDDIQAIKAGLMEVADIFVVNKSDRDGADRIVHEVLQMLEMGEHGEWLPPVLKTIARDGGGVRELVEDIKKHRAFVSGDGGTSRRRERVRKRLEAIIQHELLSRLRAGGGLGASLEEHVSRVDSRSQDPHEAARELLQRFNKEHHVSSSSTDEKPGRVLRIAHLGVAVESIEKSGGFYDVLNLLETHREEVTSQKVLTSFRPVGESFFELLEPTSGESPIAKYLQKNRPGIHHVCLEVDDVRAVLARLKENGIRLINEEPFEGAHQCLVAFVHPASTGGILLELSQKMAEAH
jgi:LAO/AO transport system kinase